VGTEASPFRYRLLVLPGPNNGDEGQAHGGKVTGSDGWELVSQRTTGDGYEQHLLRRPA
jgi:hypothetical protein